MAPKEDKRLASREELKSAINELYQKSIKENPSLLNSEHISQFKTLLYDKFPTKVLQLSQQCATVYSRETLRATAKSSDSKSIADSVPTFANASEVAKYRELFQREYRPHVAMESETLLLPDGTVPSNATFGEVIHKMLAELDQFLWDLHECTFILHLLQPPFGEEKSFDSKIIAAMLGNVDNVYVVSRKLQDHMMKAFRNRASDILQVNVLPQMTDVRHYVTYSEEEATNDVATCATLLRNNYALLHQFALKNNNRIEQILKQALKNAQYDKSI